MVEGPHTRHRLALHNGDHDGLQQRISAIIRHHLSDERRIGRTPTRGDVSALSAITAAGIGTDEALDLVESVLLPNIIALDHPNSLRTSPRRRPPAPALFDMPSSRLVVLG